MSAVVATALLLILPLYEASSWSAHLVAQSSGATRFDRVQYLGGMVGFRGTSPQWDNTLSVAPTSISMRRRDSSLLFELELTAIRNVEYFQYGRVNVFVPPTSGLGLLIPKTARTGDHFIAIEYFYDECRLGWLLLRAHKDNYKEVVTALALSHKTVEVGRGRDAPHPCLAQKGETAR
jgi:hypothetical protein